MIHQFIQKYAIALGMLTLCAALVVNQFFNDNENLDFLAGLLFGMSFAFNLTGLLQYRKKRLAQSKKDQ
ncbi:MAG TPA: hypothetical protein VKA27_03110 [Sunxiuqinia sp.]|nr:hypothetical protein [Sunxiuqinia sp.]